MADNVTIPATGSGTATPVVRTKDRTGVETQIVGIDLAPGGSETLMNGSMPVTVSPPTTPVNAKTTVTTAATRVQLANNACKSVTIKALSTNTGFIYVGDSSVAAANGFQLSAGDSVSLDIDNTNRIYIDSSVNGEGVTFLAVN